MQSTRSSIAKSSRRSKAASHPSARPDFDPSKFNVKLPPLPLSKGLTDSVPPFEIDNFQVDSSPSLDNSRDSLDFSGIEASSAPFSPTEDARVAIAGLVLPPASAFRPISPRPVRGRGRAPSRPKTRSQSVDKVPHLVDRADPVQKAAQSNTYIPNPDPPAPALISPLSSAPPPLAYASVIAPIPLLAPPIVITNADRTGPMPTGRFDHLLLCMLGDAVLSRHIPLPLFDTPILSSMLRGENDAGLENNMAPSSPNYTLPCVLPPTECSLTKDQYLSYFTRFQRTISRFIEDPPYRADAAMPSLRAAREQKKFQVVNVCVFAVYPTFT